MKYKLLYIHGITVDKNSNKALEEVCQEKGIEYLSLDLPGHGKEPFNKIELNIEPYGDFVKDWILKNNYNENLIVFGHSMGGGIASYITSQYAKELDIKKLILEDPLNGIAFQYLKKFKTHPFEVLSKVNKLKSDENSKENSYVKDWLKRITKTIPILNWDEFLRLTTNISSEETCKRLDQYYQSIDVDTSLIFGTKDCIVPFEESVEHIKQLNSSIKLYEIEDAGHGPHDEKPNLFKQTMREILDSK